jgi:tRNA(Ile)-lysidine synthase
MLRSFSKLIEKVRKSIIENELIDAGDRIVVGVSGGPDSISLLHALIELKEEFKFHIFCVHINHMIRGSESDLDEEYVKEFCSKHQTPISVYKFDIPKLAKEKKLSTEETARICRYEAFESERVKQNCDKIAIAHNKNDQVETLLMRLMRGTSPSGLACMEPIKDNLFIRPLLGISRDEIDEYCLKNNLNPRIDQSNLEPIFTRNKIRLELIPYLEKNYNENLTDSLYRLSKIAGEDKSYFTVVVEKFIANHVKFSDAESTPVTERKSINKKLSKPVKAEILIKEFNQEHPAIKKKILLSLAEKIYKAEDISYANLESALKFLESAKTSKKFQFPNEISIEISYDKAIIKKEYIKVGCEETILGKLKETIIQPSAITNLKNDDYIKYFDYDEILKENLNIVLRTRRAGDYIKPLGMSGTKTIKEIFIDEKVPREERDEIKLVCLGAKVIWIIGSRINEDFKVTRDTKQVLRLEYIK